MRSSTKPQRITRASAKDRARVLQKWVCEKISDITGHPWGPDEVISSRPMGQAGTDVRLSGLVRRVIPLAIECKNQETWDLPGWIRQAKQNIAEDLLTWALFIKKNRHEEIVVLDAQFFFAVWELLIRVIEEGDESIPHMNCIYTALKKWREYETNL
jgi:hypothetical protein